MDLSPDDEDFQGRLLHQAALWDNAELITELILAGADVNAADDHGRRALHAAALHEDSRSLRALCDAGAECDVKSDADTGGKTPLHIAAERGHATNITALLNHGGQLEAVDASGDTALVLAARGGHRQAVRVLREATDAIERERLARHAELRDLVTRGNYEGLRSAISALGTSAGIVVNMTPGGANTLLYLACESGSSKIAAALLEAGADGRAHPVTKYSPLHGAASRGHCATAALLLKHCPSAVKQVTVEQWLPLHAAVIGPHANLVTLLLEYPYPEDVTQVYTDTSGQWNYRAAFDVNAKDASGQTALYVACTLGNLAVVDALLNYSVVATRVKQEGDEESSAESQPTSSPARAGIALGIHAIVGKLSGRSKKEPPEHRIRPVRHDITRVGDSCVATAARGNHLQVLKRLLDAGASADAPSVPPEDENISTRMRRSRSAAPASSRTSSSSPSPGRSRLTDREGPWTALAIAARNKNAQIAEMLINHGATDPHNKAMQECARHGMTGLISALMTTKAYADPEYKLNKAALSEAVFSSKENDSSLTYSALCPCSPVMLNWRGLRCQLTKLRMQWLKSAALRVNTKLISGTSALHAITRVDVANNELRELPPEIFTLLSLRYLNVAQNKLERLPSPSDPFEEDLDSKGRKIKKLIRKSRPEVYSAPVLQEVYLQDNRLEDLPPSLFNLPSLTTLDVSNNKLRALPPDVWKAPRLTELNASLNHLKDLPVLVNEHESSPKPVTSPQPSPSTASSVSSQFTFPSQSQSSSRSPSIDCSESEANDDEGAIPTVGNRAGNAVWSFARRAHTWRGSIEPADPPPPPSTANHSHSRLTSLNLAHNQFVCVPAPLACLAPQLQQLNMSYNSLRSMSYVTSYPTSLRQLDLSHNEITCWPSLPQIDTTSPDNPLTCYCPVSTSTRARPRSGGSVRAQLLSAACTARRHLRLEGLRTLILANNLLTKIQLTTDDFVTTHTASHDGSTDTEDDEWGSGSALKSRLVFPQLSMLDVSCNLLRAIPPSIHELTNLAVLNISGNKEITDLPPQMGLLSRLWNLNTAGCSLSEPLASMVSGGRYRSMDVIGYLKSVLQEAHEYRRLKLMFVGLQGIGKTSLLECLRQESAIHHRRKPTDHWAKRMGNKGTRRNMSTVGVDIGTWTYEKARGGRGPVTFRTWDFGGQQEYYATHQYFLSRRSLYLVLWRASDGKRGLAGAVSWLRSIQARAPGSPVIMVATHYDQVSSANLPESSSPEALQRIIRTSIMGAGDADKLGLPRVLDSVEVSCATKHNIRLLADIIYTVAFSVKPPGSKEPLLEQRIPATYIALEEVVTTLAQELQEPVLRHEEYKRLVTQYMHTKCHKSFRDATELHQATMFLHENGVLLHYEDATLKELYFLRPQWLCDVLAHVVTVREINPFAHAGIMKVEDLAHVLKASPSLARDEASALGLSLLNKFELALCWDARTLLIPPLLPSNEPVGTSPQLLMRSRAGGWNARAESPAIPTSSHIEISCRSGGPALCRLLLLSYVPCGFWARLVTRVLADNALRVAHNAYTPPPEMEVDESLSHALDLNWGWQLWKTGLKLVCGDLTLVSVRELPASRDPLLGVIGDCGDEDNTPHNNVRFRVLMEGAWCTLDPSSSACVEITLPAQVCVLRRRDRLPVAGYQSISLEPNPETLAKLLAIVSDHVDVLLEDWYPSLGTRFVHTSEGRCLITRVVPCPGCLRDVTVNCHNDIDHAAHEEKVSQALRRLDLVGPEPRLRLSSDSRTSDGDSGVGNESNASSRLGSVEGMPYPSPRLVTAWTVEECILCACAGKRLVCSAHQDVRLADVAPDTMLLDVPESQRARWEHITRGGIAGRGAFGTVLAATWSRPGCKPVKVALKALQPVAPPQGGDLQAQHAYKAAQARWDREPSAAACRAYCGLRQELSILSQLKHAHVVPLRAVSAAPLALLLDLAPQGALDGILRMYRGAGSRLSTHVVGQLALQVARALEYLHARRIVYRDLKSENVLVWATPLPGARDAENGNVLVKLGDYGISRLAPPSGTKGFGGTEGFMAPEIMRYNGEEEYNEKVDCFSYGMLLYELMTLRQPFEGHEAVKECVLDGARPTLTPRDLEYPCCFLEIMRRCWSSAPASRPSAAALVALVTAPECAALQDAAKARGIGPATAVIVYGSDEDSAPGWEIWVAAGPDSRIHSLTARPNGFTHQHALRASSTSRITALCAAGATVWAGDEQANITVYDVASCAVSWSVSVQDGVGGPPSPIVSLSWLSSVKRVAVALKSGRLFLVTSFRPLSEGSFVCTELGAATMLTHTVTVKTPSGLELWAGGDALSAYSINDQGVHAVYAIDSSEVVLLAACESSVVSLTQTGTHIYQYCVESKELTAKLDCTKLAPCSESLQSISLDAMKEHRVTSLCFTQQQLLIAGTSNGCMIIADRSLRPLTVFRPYESSCAVVLSLRPLQPDQSPMLATLGDTYRPLVHRYVPVTTSNSTNTTAGCYCLLWRTTHWQEYS